MTTTTARKAPDKRRAELIAEHERIGRERDELERAVRELERSLQLIPDRRRELELADLRGRPEGESTEQIDSDERQTSAEIASKQTRIEAAAQAEREVMAEVDRLVGESIPFFVAQATAASERAGQAAEQAAEAIRVAEEAWRTAGAAWAIPRKACRNAGAQMPQEVPIEYAAVSSAFVRLRRADPFWPGGRRETYLRWLAEHGTALGIAEAS